MSFVSMISSLVGTDMVSFFFFDVARSIPTAIAAGATLAVTSALIDSGGQTTRVDNGREYYPYAPVEKTAKADA